MFNKKNKKIYFVLLASVVLGLAIFFAQSIPAILAGIADLNPIPPTDTGKGMPDVLKTNQDTSTFTGNVKFGGILTAQNFCSTTTGVCLDGISPVVADEVYYMRSVDKNTLESTYKECPNGWSSLSAGSISDSNQAMTSANAPTGYWAWASSSWPETPAWLAFNGVKSYFNGNYQAWGTTSNTGWVALQLPTAQQVIQYRVTAGTSYSNTPNTWKFQGSNDSSNWTDLDSQSGQTGWSGAPRTYNIANTNSYKYYRLNVSSSNGPGTYTVNLAIEELELYFAPVTTTLARDIYARQVAWGTWYPEEYYRACYRKNAKVFYIRSKNNPPSICPSGWTDLSSTGSGLEGFLGSFYGGYERGCAKAVGSVF